MPADPFTAWLAAVVAAVGLSAAPDLLRGVRVADVLDRMRGRCAQ